MKPYALVVCGILTASLLSLSGACLADSAKAVHGQKKGGGGGGGGQRGGGQRSAPQRSAPSRPAPVEHARREVVRTPNFVPRPSPTFTPRTPSRPAEAAPREPSRPAVPSSRAVYRPKTLGAAARVPQRTFSKTAAGRVYDNGLHLRKGMPVTAAWQKRYFPKGHFHFPYYRPTFVRGSCFISPFGFYFGVCVPFIDASFCNVFPPTVTFIDMPVYNGNDCSGFNDENDENLLNDPNLDADQPGLSNALDELVATFQNGNIDGLVSLIDPNTSIAVYLRGKYQYSMPANDYVDLTRDAVTSMQSSTFTIEFVHQRSPQVFSVAGHQTYKDASGQDQTVWLSFVLQDISGQLTLTQVGTAPAHYHSLIN